MMLICRKLREIVYKKSVFHVSSGRLADMLFITVFILGSLRSMEKCRTWVQEH